MESKINYMSNCKRKMIAENAAFSYSDFSVVLS